MIEAPTNPWTEAENRLAAALPHLAAFQEFCEVPAGTPDPETHSNLHVFLEELGCSQNGERYTADELNEVRYYAIVSSARENAYRFDRITTDGFRCTGNLLLYLDRKVPPEQESYGATIREAHVQQDRWMKNRVGQLLQELALYWHEIDDGGLWIQSAAIVAGPLHTHPDERETIGHWQSVEVTIAWGEPAAAGQ